MAGGHILSGDAIRKLDAQDNRDLLGIEVTTLSSMRNCYSNDDHGEPSDAIFHKSPYPDIAIPDMTMWQVAEKQAKINADTPAFVCGLTREAISFSDPLGCGAPE
ncbi:hypothetical protein PHYPSEUDO_002543 [Phytophthora pseudosyringae]|uniref:Uncharacterized protein n=1 Tax=Phytophthora pseudosyringae TaxID=221518 RepID=A0A8T1VTH9_9STRA|nr:hypothetical protein PHYPSEUDO_002543 [Phytophthora pseudosyringae]